jgi:hypothetical protein
MNAAIQRLHSEQLDSVTGGENVQPDIHRLHIKGKGDLVYGTIEVEGYKLPVAQWHPVK